MDKLNQQIEDLDILINSCKNDFADMYEQSFYRLNQIEEEAYRFSSDKKITAKLDEQHNLERIIRQEQDDVVEELLGYRRKLLNEKEDVEYKRRKEGVSSGA